MNFYKSVYLAIAVLFAIGLVGEKLAYGQTANIVPMNEDQIMICFNAVWDDIKNNTVCKVFDNDTIEDIKHVYNNQLVWDLFTHEIDTFDLEQLD